MTRATSKTNYDLRRNTIEAWLAAEPEGLPVLDGPAAAVGILAPHLLTAEGQPREEERVAVAALDSQHRVIDTKVLSVGSARFTIVCPATIYRWALLRSRPPAAIVMAHQHPSGSADPSKQDEAVTHRMAAAGQTLGIPLLDHLIIGAAGRWTSLVERGVIQPPTRSMTYTG